ncbi:MAG: TadE family protein [Candidatus Ozemobacteraceae bacterium]
MKKINRSGQATVELALMLPIFMFILLGIFDFTRVFHTYSTLNMQCAQAARVATRRLNPMIARSFYGPNTHSPLASVTQAFDQYRSPLMNAAKYSNKVWGGVGVAVNTVTISAEYSFDLITPGASRLVGRPGDPAGTITLRGYAQERKE